MIEKKINNILSECSKLAQTIVYDYTRLGGKVDPHGTVQEIGIWPYKQMLCAQPNICPGKWDAKTPLELWDTNGSPTVSHMTRPYYNQQQQQKKKRIHQIMDFAVPTDHLVKLKMNNEKNKYLDLERELKKNCGTWKWRWYQLSLVFLVQ